MTDKQILDRLHNINLSHAQKMDLISVIKDIAKENSGGGSNPPSSITDVNITITDNSNKPAINFVAIFENDIMNDICIFNKLNLNTGDKITYDEIDESLGNNMAGANICYAILMLLGTCAATINSLELISESGIINTIKTKIVLDTANNNFDIIVHSETYNKDYTITFTDNKTDGYIVTF